jgi:hypothetical protein
LIFLARQQSHAVWSLLIRHERDWPAVDDLFMLNSHETRIAVAMNCQSCAATAPLRTLPQISAAGSGRLQMTWPTDSFVRLRLLEVTQSLFVFAYIN